MCRWIWSYLRFGDWPYYTWNCSALSSASRGSCWKWQLGLSWSCSSAVSEEALAPCAFYAMLLGWAITLFKRDGCAATCWQERSYLPFYLFFLLWIITERNKLRSLITFSLHESHQQALMPYHNHIISLLGLIIIIVLLNVKPIGNLLQPAHQCSGRDRSTLSGCLPTQKYQHQLCHW